jgi:hypothetical protein
MFYRFLTTTQQKERMADVRKAWLGAMVNVKDALPVRTDDGEKDNGTAALLLDRRLVRTKGARIMSFIAGTVATFLQKDFLPDCEVLRDVAGEKLKQLLELFHYRFCCVPPQ